MEQQKKRHTLIKIIVILVFIITGLLLYSRFISTKGLKVKEYKITNSVITDNFHGFKIVHISDIHYGRTIKSKELENLVNEKIATNTPAKTEIMKLEDLNISPKVIDSSSFFAA